MQQLKCYGVVVLYIIQNIYQQDFLTTTVSFARYGILLGT